MVKYVESKITVERCTKREDNIEEQEMRSLMLRSEFDRALKLIKANKATKVNEIAKE